MKKLLIVLLMAAVLLVGCKKTQPEETVSESGTESQETSKEYEIVPEAPEEEAYEAAEAMDPSLTERIRGDWFAFWEGLALKLTLNDDGTYSFVFPGRETQKGAWAIHDGLVALDGSEGDLIPLDDVLNWSAAGLLFTRNEPETFVPGEVITNAVEGAFNGYWKSQYVAVDGGTVFSSAIGEETDIYIEGTQVALGGPLFGDVIVEMKLQDGMLTYEKDGMTVTLAVQQDSYLRLTVENGNPGEAPITVYLFPAIPGWVNPEDIAAE